MEAGKITGDVRALRQSIEDMGKHIATLSADVLTEGKTQSREAARETLNRLESQYNLIRDRMADASDDVTRRAKEIDATVHAKPYWFLAGAAGLGYMLGKTRRRH